MSELPDSVEAARAILAKHLPANCTCTSCVKMCKHKPCWATPEDITAILDSGVDPKKLMLDFWQMPNGERLYLISPAIVEFGGKRAPAWPVGRCVMLVDDRCSIYHVQPFEGAISIHDRDYAEPENPHPAIAKLWDSENGRAVVQRWCAAAEYAIPAPDTTEDFLDLVCGLMGQLDHYADGEGESG